MSRPITLADVDLLRVRTALDRQLDAGTMMRVVDGHAMEVTCRSIDLMALDQVRVRFGWRDAEVRGRERLWPAMYMVD